MTVTRPIEEARTPDLRGSKPALRRAACRAREIAAQTGTAVVIVRNGMVEHVYPQARAPARMVHETAPPHGNGA